MKTTKRILVLIVALACLMSVMSLAACDKAGGKGTKVGVAMPTQSLQRWNQDGANMKKSLEEAGFVVDLQYANNEVATQLSQIENMITSGCKVLVIASIDGSSLGNVLADAKKEKIPVIAYDRLIMETDGVSYYATFDNFKVGELQGKFIEEKLDLKNAAGPFNIELFAGSPDDNNALFFFNGAMSILQPYIDSGKLNVVSGQTDFATIAINEWKTERAQNRMDDLLTANYATGTKLDVVLSPNDSLALGIANALEQGGFVPGTNWPIVTGQDCDVANMKNVIAGKQSMSIFKDTRTLADKVVEMVKAIIEGTTVPVNDEKTYNNGVKVVPSFLCDPVFADVNNYEDILIKSGYYTADQLA
ncbi:MAG: sugar ABC transporter substrate-binding protein [Clostridiaceae bacterium]|nr:sugar ABC transporter substrate-binding protein [Clostridiaceae bacterium]